MLDFRPTIEGGCFPTNLLGELLRRICVLFLISAFVGNETKCAPIQFGSGSAFCSAVEENKHISHTNSVDKAAFVGHEDQGTPEPGRDEQQQQADHLSRSNYRSRRSAASRQRCFVFINFMSFKRRSIDALKSVQFRNGFERTSN